MEILELKISYCIYYPLIKRCLVRSHSSTHLRPLLQFKKKKEKEKPSPITRKEGEIDGPIRAAT